MSILETEAQSILIGLAEGTSSLSELSSSQCFSLARWACKTAFVLHAASNYRPIVSAKHFRAIRDDTSQLPLGVYVHGRQHESTQPFAWWQGSAWFVDAEEDTLTPEIKEVLKAEAYKICFTIKDLILIVSYNPFTNMLPVLWKWNHISVFPERGPVFWYERDDFPKEDTQRACIALFAGMGLKQRDDQASQLQGTQKTAPPISDVSIKKL